MSQLVFIHGNGAGGCADAYYHQLRHFPGSIAPDLPGRLGMGARCPDIPRYTEWLRGWLWAQGLNKDLVLVGYTLGAAMALQYGLDYPDEVQGLVVMSVSARPKVFAERAFDIRTRATDDPKYYEQWMNTQRHTMQFVEPELRERLLERHRQVGPLTQYHDFMLLRTFDIRDRLATLKPKLLLLRGLRDPGNPPEYEKEIHEAVPGSSYVTLAGAGHFPATECPDQVNGLIEEFVAAL